MAGRSASMSWPCLTYVPGQTALDIGCGPGLNLIDLAAGGTSMGNVIGVDCDPVMIAAAQRRTVEYSAVDVRLGDVHALPVAASSVDRGRADRVLQHVDDPAAVIAELRRVTRPGAVVTLAEPDWATLAVDADDLRTSADFTRYICAEAVKNSSIGRQLARLAGAVGFTVRSVQPVSPLFSDYADRILGLTRSSRRAVAAGCIDEPPAGRWLASLRQPPFLATCTFFIVAAEVPA
jgi:ubiquinone/menaquinone biosynthesis C-methylase UbiE